MIERDRLSTHNQFARIDRVVILLVLLGVISSLLIAMGLLWKIDNLKGVGTLCTMAYSIVLIWWLARSRPMADERPDFAALITVFRSYWVMVALISVGAGLVFSLTGIVLGNGWLMVPLSTLLAIVILIMLRTQLNRKIIIAGIMMLAALFCVEFILQPTNVQGGIVNALLIAFQAMAGLLLLCHTRLTSSQLYDGHLRKAMQSFCWGCVLAIPPALFNIASFTSNNLTHVDRRFGHWWNALYALQPALLEETWARLFLLTLFYAILRPVSRQKPQRAVTAALIMSVCVHGLAHYPQSLSDPVSALVVALLYGMPLGLIYIKRDYESALAYHFLLDVVRFAFMASLLS